MIIFGLHMLTYKSLIYPAYVVSYKFLISYACENYVVIDM